uniref:H/ACA ribonucleoprotein complex non-core subunit NAF1 n=1 Tax=Trichobilharzia regenti TaxID=157069 RepID=A0AA85JRM4_TRIRE|nr:unnamed protein product [Trichobilharzia regenti]
MKLVAHLHMETESESTLPVNSLKDVNNRQNSPCTIHETSSSETSSDSEPEKIERPVFRKPKDPVFSVPSDYVLKSVADLTADVKTSLLGKVSQVFDDCVVVRSVGSAVVLDEGSALFLDDGRHLGEIYETFGPVRSPFYLVVLSESFCIRSQRPNKHITTTIDLTTTKLTECSEEVVIKNEEVDSAEVSVEITTNNNLDSVDNEHSENGSVNENCPTVSSSANSDTSNDNEEKKIANQSLKEVSVFYAPDMPELTLPVFYNKLVANNTKGSDASWVGNIEPPPEVLEFSDDEQEKQYKRKLKMKHSASTSVEPSSSYQKHINRSKNLDNKRGRSSLDPKGHQTPSSSSHQTRAPYPTQQQQQIQQVYNFTPSLQPYPVTQWNVHPNMQPQWHNSTYGATPVIQSPYFNIPQTLPQQYPFPYNMPTRPYQHNPWQPFAPS